MERSDVVRQVSNLIAIPLGIVFTFQPFLFGTDVEQYARSHETVLAATGWTFAIWLVILCGQVAYAVFQALPAHRTDATLRRVGYNTALNGLLGGLFTIAFARRQLSLSVLLMAALLVNLIVIEVRLRADARTGVTWWFVRLPFALNLGWVVVASLLHLSLYLYAVVWQNGAPMSQLAWAHSMVVVAAVAATLMVFARHELAFALAIAWGLLGIATYRREDVRSLAILSLLLCGLLVFFSFIDMLSRRERQRMLWGDR